MDLRTMSGMPKRQDSEPNFCVQILLVFVSVSISTPLPHFTLYSVNKYFTVSAKTITKALKPEYQAKASRRFITEVKAQTFKNGELTKAVDLSTGKQLNL